MSTSVATIEPPTPTPTAAAAATSDDDTPVPPRLVSHFMFSQMTPRQQDAIADQLRELLARTAANENDDGPSDDDEDRHDDFVESMWTPPGITQNIGRIVRRGNDDELPPRRGPPAE